MAFIGALSGTQTQGSSSVNTLFGAGSGISGLASGLNTDSIIDGLMQAESLPLVSLLQQRQITQWQQALYQKVGNSLTALRQTIQPLELQSTFLAQTASSSDSAQITATATPQTASGSYSVSVRQLAQGSSVSSSQSLITAANTDIGNTTLGDLVGDSAASYSVTINGKVFNFDSKTTVNDALSQITHDASAGVSAFYDSSSGKVVLQSSATGTGAQIKISSDSANLFSNYFKISTPTSAQQFTFTPISGAQGFIEINGQQVVLDSTQLQSAQSVADAINAKSLGITATATTDSTTGVQTLSLTYAPGTANVSPIALYDETGTLFGNSLAQGTAQDAIYSVNGYTTASSTNSVSYNGLTLGLHAVTTSPVSVTVSPDTDAIVSKVMDFVKQYNNTVQYMQALVNQKRNLDYKPLTAQQASQMTQPQIDKWNQAAQSGLLSNDMILGNSMDGFITSTDLTMTGQPSIMLNGVPTELNSLSSIGIKLIDPVNGVDDGYSAPNVATTGYNSFGLIEINEDTLKQAIQASPQGVMNLFTNSTAGNQGFAVQMYNTLTNSINSITTEAGVSGLQPPADVTNPSSDILPSTPIDPTADLSTLFSGDGSDISTLGESINGLDSRATDMQMNLQDLKQRYQQEFSAMESALANMNSMSSAFQSMMGGSGSSG